MKIIKLNAINSTNSFLKEMAQNSSVKNFTTVITQNQTSGRGQTNKEWISEPFKNLTFSTFILCNDLTISNQKYLNLAVSLTVFDALKEYKIPNLSIKWPNDILSENKKLCGILIENIIKNKQIQYSIIGIGINVNQDLFHSDLPNATSIKKITGKQTNLEQLLTVFLAKLKDNITLLEQKQFTFLEDKYITVLYKRNVLSVFRNKKGNLFMGIIKGISADGKLQILLENDTIKEFGIKEVSFT